VRPDFSYRSNDLEIMDDLNCEGEVVNQTLREIAYINKTLGGNGVTLSGISKLLNGKSGDFTIADLGCGGGEMLSYVHSWGKKKQLDFQLTGFDANPNIIGFARENEKGYNFLCENVLSPSFFNKKFDIITCTLFTHHFSSFQLAKAISHWIGQITTGIVINDLHRHPLAYYSIKLLTSLFSKSAMVKYDAPLSVLRGFTKREWEEILQGAGVKNYRIKWRWAFRWEVVIFK